MTGFIYGNRAAKQVLVLGRSACRRPVKSECQRREDAPSTRGSRRDYGGQQPCERVVKLSLRVDEDLCAPNQIS